MSQASLHDARIVRPLHRVHDRIETRSHQVAQMPSPAVFALHVHSDSEVDAQPTLTGKSWFLVLRPVISTLYCRHLATDAEKCCFLCELRCSSHAAQPPQPLTAAAARGSPALHMAYTQSDVALTAREEKLALSSTLHYDFRACTGPPL
jgi:hypothetical protein